MIEQIGTVGQYACPVYAAGWALYKKQWKEFFTLGALLIINQIALETLKTVVPRNRPNGHTRSFPSGHTAAAFLGASFVAKHHGFVASLPSFAYAIFVGYSRYYCKAHWISDIAVGALLGTSLAVAPSLSRFKINLLSLS